jgi:hypothetical protein
LLNISRSEQRKHISYKATWEHSMPSFLTLGQLKLLQ